MEYNYTIMLEEFNFFHLIFHNTNRNLDQENVRMHNHTPVDFDTEYGMFKEIYRITGTCQIEHYIEYAWRAKHGNSYESFLYRYVHRCLYYHYLTRRFSSENSNDDY